MNDRIRAYIWDAIDAGKDVMSFVSGGTFADYSSSKLLQAAVERKLEIIGEALKRIRDESPATAELLEPNKAAIALRNLIAHEYDSVDQSILWIIANRDVPALIAQLESYLVDEPL